jgi:dipeptidyl aminopeptidase/acylaminoacyl peptidase
MRQIRTFVGRGRSIRHPFSKTFTGEAFRADATPLVRRFVVNSSPLMEPLSMKTMFSPRLSVLAAWLTFAAVVCAPVGAFAQGVAATEAKYRTPPKAIADLVDAPPTPGVGVSPKRTWLALLERPNLPPISEIAQPEVRIAGFRINPRTNGPSQAPFVRKLTLMRLSDQTQRDIQGLPSEPRIGNVLWSPDERHIAFTLTRESGVEAWVADVATMQAKRLGGVLLNAAYGGRPIVWSPKGDELLCKTVPENRGSAPAPPTVPDGPVIQENRGKSAPVRTFQDLLKNSHDEALFDHYCTTQIVRLKLDGTATKIGAPGVIASATPSPDGAYVLAQTTHRPYSYLVPAGRFPNRVEIWNARGEVVRQIADLPLQEASSPSFDAVPPGPRSFSWRADAPATLCWVEALDDGDPAKPAEFRDKVAALSAPFQGDAKTLLTLKTRFAGLTWGDDKLAFAYEFWYKTRTLRTWLFAPAAAEIKPEMISERSVEDRYNDPGNFLTRVTETGASVLLTPDGGKTLYLSGDGASPEGDRPFLDKFVVATRKTERLWRSEAPHYETFVATLDADAGKILITRETKTEPTNFYVRDMASKALAQLTKFPHPTPQLIGVQKEQIRYKRADGVDLTATLYLPPGYDAKRDGALPLMMWAYPQEFKSAAAAGQTSGSPYQFARIGYFGPEFLLTQGYAVLDDPSFPIIGEGGKEPNDTYIEQLVADAQAAIDECVRRGVADRNRVAIGGHSYGAFMTVNLLAHSRLFRAGIARSGAYNRTLTPFGFQAEERTFWQARDIYQRMSPFNYADRIKDSLLIIHGEADDNPGTFPIQSERLYQAVKGLGGTTRLVMLPHERHGYRARESVLHMLWEMNEWLENAVKNAKPSAAASPVETK